MLKLGDTSLCVALWKQLQFSTRIKITQLTLLSWMKHLASIKMKTEASNGSFLTLTRE